MTQCRASGSCQAETHIPDPQVLDIQKWELDTHRTGLDTLKAVSDTHRTASREALSIALDAEETRVEERSHLWWRVPQRRLLQGYLAHKKLLSPRTTVGMLLLKGPRRRQLVPLY